MPEPAHTTPPCAGRDTGHAATTTPVEPEPCLVVIEVAADGDRTDVAVRGELDLDTDRHVETTLHASLNHAVHGLDLHLGAVHFCDCVGLGMLLRLRSLALEQNKTVTIRTTSRAVSQILDLTGTRELFGSPAPHGRSAPRSPTRSRAPRQDTDEELRTELGQLRRAMQTRPAIDQARGILMAAFGLCPEAAWTVLVTTSQKTNTKLHRLAQSLIDSLQGTALPRATQKQLATAINAVNSTSPAPASSPAGSQRK
ncbi:ANTAR domain-containing protein [Streptomyces sp. NPDC007100]|uniref:ANTAR domain-containing protein n=1 Tax=Streptomyces sp. NPDC007100 TaxID=3155602 RepID=UPI0033F85A63